jgi:hypothetical protein
MAFSFTTRDFRKLSNILRTEPKRVGNVYRFNLDQKLHKRRLTLEIYPNISIGKQRGNLISVYTENAHLQLHFCSGYVTSEMLGEVTFIGEYNGKLSGLIVEREGGCSLYANVNRELLSGDFTKLGPEVMLSGIALSLTESILPEATDSSKKKRSTRKR